MVCEIYNGRLAVLDSSMKKQCQLLKLWHIRIKVGIHFINFID